MDREASSECAPADRVGKGAIALRGDQPFTLPASRPEMKYFWVKMKTI